MAYTDFDKTKPDPSTQTPGQAFTSDRNNLLAMRDAIIAGVGSFPGWAWESQNSDGSAPPTDPTKPGQIVWSKSTDRIKLVITWGTTGGALDQPTRLVCSYSANSGTSYDVIKGGSTNGYFDLTYDTSGNALSGAWS